MKAFDPELLVVAHLPRCVPHDRIQIVADECAGIVTGNLRRVDDGGARADQRLEVVHDGHAFAERLLRLLAVGNIRPRTDDFKWTTLSVVDDPERVLDPDVTPVPMPEAILYGPSAFIDQRDHFPEDALGILWMETYSPEVFVFEHLPRGKSHDAGHVLADEGACIVARQIGVDDGRRDRHQVTQPFAGGFQFGGAILDPLLQLIVRLAEFFLLALTRTEIGGEAD